MNKVGLILLSLSLMSVSDLGGVSTPKRSIAHEEDYYEEFTPLKLMEYIKEKQIRFPKVVFAQSILETGHYSSEVYEQNHNLFGMRMPKKRPTVAMGSNLNHAVYKHWTECVDDYALWQDYVLRDRKIKNDNHYLIFLSEYGYAEAGKYEEKLRIIIKKYLPLYLKDNNYWENKKKKRNATA